MTIACFSLEQCQQRAFEFFENHVNLLEGWIEVLNDKANEILLCEASVTETDRTLSGAVTRTVRGLQLDANRIITTIMRLSKEKLKAAVMLSRLDFTGELAAARANAAVDNPCAREGAKQAEAAAAASDQAAAKPVMEATCGEATKSASSPVRDVKTPVRAAAEPTVNDVLREPLAHDEFDALGNFDAAEFNNTIRRERRQRAKQLQRVKAR